MSGIEFVLQSFAFLTASQSDLQFPGKMPFLILIVFNLWKWLLISLLRILISCHAFIEEVGFVLHFFSRRALLFILFLMWGGCDDLQVEL